MNRFFIAVAGVRDVGLYVIYAGEEALWSPFGCLGPTASFILIPDTAEAVIDFFEVERRVP